MTRPKPSDETLQSDVANSGGTILVGHLLSLQAITERTRDFNARMAEHLGFILGREHEDEAPGKAPVMPGTSVIDNIGLARMHLSHELDLLEDHIARLEGL